jgi:hypothetical protein
MKLIGGATLMIVLSTFLPPLIKKVRLHPKYIVGHSNLVFMRSPNAPECLFEFCSINRSTVDQIDSETPLKVEDYFRIRHQR